MNFPAAATVLVFNVNGGESETSIATSTAPPRAPITVPKPLPTPSTGSPLQADETGTKEQRLEKELRGVDASAFEIASTIANQGVLLPDEPLPTGFTYPT